jgi:prepilin-type N-terminal cleavage/methylation domain-containing protein
VIRPDVRHAEGGFSLVEVLVALVILAFVALGVQGTLTAAIWQSRLAQERSEATDLAAARVNQLTSMAYQSAANFAAYKLPEETAVTGTPKTLTTATGSIPGFPQFSRTVTLKYDVPTTGMLAVQVDVNWTNRGQGVQKTHRVVTFIQPGLQE